MRRAQSENPQPQASINAYRAHAYRAHAYRAHAYRAHAYRAHAYRTHIVLAPSCYDRFCLTGMSAPTAVSPPTIPVVPPQAIIMAPPPYVPLPSLPPMVLDKANNRVGFAQRMTRAKALIARNDLFADGLHQVCQMPN